MSSAKSIAGLMQSDSDSELSKLSRVPVCIEFRVSRRGIIIANKYIRLGIHVLIIVCVGVCKKEFIGGSRSYKG